jgi:hypothetical protein
VVGRFEQELLESYSLEERLALSKLLTRLGGDSQ